MLAKLRPQPGQQDIQAERLRDIIVGTGIQPQDLV